MALIVAPTMPAALAPPEGDAGPGQDTSERWPEVVRDQGRVGFIPGAAEEHGSLDWGTFLMHA